MIGKPLTDNMYNVNNTCVSVCEFAILYSFYVPCRLFTDIIGTVLCIDGIICIDTKGSVVTLIHNLKPLVTSRVHNIRERE